MKQFAALGFILLTSTLLSACAFSPRSNVSREQQCIHLQHQMVFAGSFNPATSSVEKTNADRYALNQSFQRLHCYDVLENARKGQPSK